MCCGAPGSGHGRGGWQTWAVAPICRRTQGVDSTLSRRKARATPKTQSVASKLRTSMLLARPLAPHRQSGHAGHAGHAGHSGHSRH